MVLPTNLHRTHARMHLNSYPCPYHTTESCTDKIRTFFKTFIQIPIDKFYYYLAGFFLGRDRLK